MCPLCRFLWHDIDSFEYTGHGAPLLNVNKWVGDFHRVLNLKIEQQFRLNDPFSHSMDFLVLVFLRWYSQIRSKISKNRHSLLKKVSQRFWTPIGVINGWPTFPNFSRWRSTTFYHFLPLIYHFTCFAIISFSESRMTFKLKPECCA